MSTKFPKHVDFTERNKAIISWATQTTPELKAQLTRFNIKSYTGAMRRQLKHGFSNRDGNITAVGFKMPRHAIYVHKGVGRGWPAGTQSRSTGKVMQGLLDRGYNPKTAATYAQRLKGKQRKPKPWFNPVIDKRLKNLADAMAKHDADIVAKSILIQ